MVRMPRSAVVARLRLRLQHHGAGAVAEQHAGAAVVPVEDAREGLGADHQRALEGAGAQELVGGRQREDEARADRLQVERRAMGDAEAVLHRHRGGGKVLSGVEVASTIRSIDCASTCGIGERGARGMQREIGGELAGGGDMALADAGALHDPFVGGVDRLCQFGIGENACCGR